MTKFGPGLVHSPAGPGPGHLGSGPVRTWVCQDQDQTLDSLLLVISMDQETTMTRWMFLQTIG